MTSIVTETTEDFIADLEAHAEDLRDFAHSVDNVNNHMQLDMETEFLINKFTCPNGHALYVKTCSCSDTDIQQKNIILTCEENCSFDDLRVLDCGNHDCSLYDR